MRHCSNPAVSFTRLLMLLALLLSVVSGCAEREQAECPTDGLLRMDFRWPEDCEVAGTQVWISDGQDGTLHTSCRCDAYSHELRLPQGIYSIRSANTDFINADYIGNGIIRIRKDNAKGTLLNVGKVYCTGVDGITVEAGGLPAEVVLHHKNVVRTIRLVLDTEGIGPFEMMELRLSGIVPSVCVSDGSDAGEPAEDAGVTVRTNSRGDSGTRHTAVMSVFGWRGANTLTATVHRAGGSVETVLPQEIGSLLDGLSASGGSGYITLKMSSGEIGVSVTVSSWQSGTGTGTVGCRS